MHKRILTNHLMFANDFLKIWSPYWSETKSVVWDNLKIIGKITNGFITIQYHIDYMYSKRQRRLTIIVLPLHQNLWVTCRNRSSPINSGEETCAFTH